MASGMTSRGQQERLAALLAQAGGPRQQAAEPTLSARHCWVIDPHGWPGTWPGLLHEWRRAGPGWVGVVTVAVLHQGRQIVVQIEVPAARLRPL